IVQGWATRPSTLTGWPWRRPEGIPGTLTARISASPSPKAISCTTYSGSPFSSARGCLVSNARTGWGSRAHRNAIADVFTGSFMVSLLQGYRLVALYDAAYRIPRRPSSTPVRERVSSLHGRARTNPARGSGSGGPRRLDQGLPRGGRRDPCHPRPTAGLRVRDAACQRTPRHLPAGQRATDPGSRPHLASGGTVTSRLGGADRRLKGARRPAHQSRENQ